MALDFFAGCVGGCAGVVVGYPLDTIKVHLQTQDARRPVYRSTLDCARQLVARDGARSLFRGMASPLVGVSGINAIVFGVYGLAQRSAPQPDALATHAFAGAFAGFAQSFLSAPTELVKLRAQCGAGGVELTTRQALAAVLRADGWRGLTRGTAVTIAREVPGFASYFWTYEFVTRLGAAGAPAGTATMLLAGGTAGVVSWLLSYPADVLKTRVQCDARGEFAGARDCLRRSAARESGYAFLWRGLAPTLVRAFPVNAAVFTVVTWTMRLGERLRGTLADHADAGGGGGYAIAPPDVVVAAAAPSVVEWHAAGLALGSAAALVEGA